jgi:acetyl-CoA C-acetyltransferase
MKRKKFMEHPVNDQDIVIVAAKRTPIGAFQGILSPLKAPQLGSVAIKGAMDALQLSPKDISEVIMGCVLSAGLGQAPARQASLGAGIDQSVPCMTINKVCGSGMKAVMLAHDQIKLNPDHILVAGGMESMTNAPYLLDRARSGYRLGHGKILDHLFFDGLEDAYHQGQLMGNFADATAAHLQFSRQDQDAYALTSLQRTQEAMKAGYFEPEITPIDFGEGKGRVEARQDETPAKVKVEKIPLLKPAFSRDGTVTGATSSSIADGAAALILMSAGQANHRGAEAPGCDSGARIPRPGARMVHNCSGWRHRESLRTRKMVP